MTNPGPVRAGVKYLWAVATIDPAGRPAEHLEGLLEFEILISDTSAVLLSAPPEALDHAVERCLERVREFFRVDRCAFLEVSSDQEVIHVRLASYSEGVPPVPTDLNLAPAFPWSRHKLLVERAAVRIPRLADLPAEAATEREAWIQMPIRSALTLPIETNGVIRHLIVLNTVHREREWPDVFVTRLRVLGEMLTSAMERREALVRLRDSEARLASGTDLAGLAFYEADFVHGVMYLDDRLRALLGFPPERERGLEPLAFWMDHLHPEDKPRVLEVRDQLQTGGLERLAIEYRYLHPTEGEKWIDHLAGVAASDAGGRALRTYGVLRDSTERRRREEALRQSLAEIERLRDRLQAETDYLRAEMRVTLARGEITGQSAAVQQVLRKVEQVAATDSTVLVLGETGTGKELVAQLIHRLSARHDRLMVTVNCAALPSGLVESELFGREKGAYTGALTRQVGRFEVADGSTIFLDEVGELPLEVQAKLLRVLERGEFERLGSPKTLRTNARLIAATNRDLLEGIRNGRFREDLYYRLNIFPIAVPPLRERREDIPLLVWTFLEEFSTRMGKRITQVPRRTMEALQRHSWPGNVRELRNVLEHAAILTTGDTLRVPMLEAGSAAPAGAQTLGEVERLHIVRVLEQTGWQVKGPQGAAAVLGLNPSTLYSRMKKLGIERQGR